MITPRHSYWFIRNAYVPLVGILLVTVAACGPLLRRAYEVKPIVNDSVLSASPDNKSASKNIFEKRAQVIDLASFSFPTGPAYQSAICSQDKRDRLLGYLRRASDEACSEHKAGIMAQSTGTSLFMTLVSLGLTGGASVASGGAANALAAAATGITGSKAAIDSEVYHQLFVTAIIDGLDTSRLEKWNQIVERMTKPVTRDPAHCKPDVVPTPRSLDFTGLEEIRATPGEKSRIVEKDPDVYTVDQALADIEDYHLRCSFYNGLVKLKDEIAEAKRKASGGSTGAATATATATPSATKSPKPKATPVPSPTA